MKLFTPQNGYDFFEVASLLQKSLRRGDITMASRAANEMLPKYANYVWNRLMTVSAEDCADMITAEIVGLHDGWLKVNEGKPGKPKGRVFIAKAIILLAKAKHSRDADELNILVSDRIPAEEFEQALAQAETILDTSADQFDIPHWVYDIHTRRGKKMGKTKKDFLAEEHDALTHQTTLFDNIDQMIASTDDDTTWVPPQISYHP